MRALAKIIFLLFLALVSSSCTKKANPVLEMKALLGEIPKNQTTRPTDNQIICIIHNHFNLKYNDLVEVDGGSGMGQSWSTYEVKNKNLKCKIHFEGNMIENKDGYYDFYIREVTVDIVGEKSLVYNYYPMPILPSKP